MIVTDNVKKILQFASDGKNPSCLYCGSSIMDCNVDHDIMFYYCGTNKENDLCVRSKRCLKKEIFGKNMKDNNKNRQSKNATDNFFNDKDNEMEFT